jgi:Mg-chelatase subunit ChlD
VIAEARRRTTARRDLERNPRFSLVSPAPGQVDELALDDLVVEDPDAALALVADMTGAVDPALRDLARRLAGRIAVRISGQAGGGRSGSLRLSSHRGGDGGDVDVDASLAAVAESRRARRATEIDELVSWRWARRSAALGLVVDHSGSMGGARLATAALAAAVVATRAPDAHCVIAFAADATVVKGIEEERTTDAVVDDLLALRGHGPTDLALGLETARRQLSPWRGTRRVVVLLSDCRATVTGDPVAAAAWADELVVLAPAGDSAEAADLVRRCGGRLGEVAVPTDVPRVLAALLA